MQEELISKNDQDILFVDVDQGEVAGENRIEKSSDNVDKNSPSNQNNNETNNLMTAKEYYSGFVFVDVNESENQEKKIPNNNQDGSAVINPILDSQSVKPNNNMIRKNLKVAPRRRAIKLSDNDDNIEFIIKKD